MGELEVRRVVTGHVQGQATFTSDGTPPRTIAMPGGSGVSELLWLDGPPADVDAGGDRDGGGFPLEPPTSGLSARIVALPSAAPDAPAEEAWLRIEGDDPNRPGMHRTDTLDLVVVLAGAVTLDLGDGEHLLGAGDLVVQRGSRHRWRPEPRRVHLPGRDGPPRSVRDGRAR